MVADLVEGGARVLAERGPEGFTTNHVARATGASIGSLYQYFPNKGALLAALHDRDGAALWDVARRILREEERPPAARLEAVVVLLCCTQAEAAALHRALDHEEVDATATPGFRRLRGQALEDLAGFIEQAHPERAAKAHRLARLALSTLFGALELLAEDPSDADGVARDVVTMIASILCPA